LQPGFAAVTSVNPTSDFAAQAGALVEIGREFHARGWVPASGGNFSARVDASSIAITVSGRHKGRLTPADIMLADLDGNSLSPGKKPSAETLLHTMLYRRDPQLGGVLHTHSPAATVLSLTAGGRLVLQGYELLKIFPGVASHETRLHLPIFPNDQDMPRLSARVDAWITEHGVIHAYLIAGHGLYTWAGDVRQAGLQVEALEFMLECELLRRRAES
jgi:methylthioribulose-1-phosphate dehydratase